MPVEDHFIHPSTVINSSHRPGCYNKSRERTGYWVQDGWDHSHWPVSTPMWVFIKDTGSLGCRQIVDLPECSGCTSQKDHAYIEKMRTLI